MIPEFDGNGNLPPGTYQATISEVIDRFQKPNHGSRKNCSENLAEFYNFVRLIALGIYIDGSYITAKLAPEDVDILVLVSSNVELSPPQYWVLNRWNQKKFFLHIFVYREVGPGFDRLQRMIDYFCHDRDGHPKGIVYVEIAHDKK